MKRHPFQGLWNIIRFNRHFYLFVLVISVLLLLFWKQLPAPVQKLLVPGMAVAMGAMLLSLLVSWYVYDVSDLYRLKWLKQANGLRLLNINAGFDETSDIIQRRFPQADLAVCDFYDPSRHTEISMKRAREAYPPHPMAVSVETGRLPFPDNSFDASLVTLAAHEIRKEKERIQFFKELRRITKPAGQIMVTEHLRDWPNFLAYTIGFFHFHSRRTWLKDFKQAGLIVREEIKTTPFISTFILEKHGNTD